MSEVCLAELWRGPILECVHYGHVAICNSNGDLIAGCGEAHQPMLPRSSAKILQALPLMESGAAKAAGLNAERLALACASHSGERIHVDLVTQWLHDIGGTPKDLLCGPQPSSDADYRFEMKREGQAPLSVHNNCSGKHAGFLTLSKHLGADKDYIRPDHVVQQSVKWAIEDMADETITGFAIDGCSAPNFAVTLKGLATAMAKIAAPKVLSGARAQAAETLSAAMAAHPYYVAGKDRACTRIMNAVSDGTVVKTGAEGVFIAIIPSKGLGVALKITDGATRASEAAIAEILCLLGIADRNHPAISTLVEQPVVNWKKTQTGVCKAYPNLGSELGL